MPREMETGIRFPAAMALFPAAANLHSTLSPSSSDVLARTLARASPQSGAPLSHRHYSLNGIAPPTPPKPRKFQP